MAGTNYGEDVAKRLRGLWSSFMSYTSQENQQVFRCNNFVPSLVNCKMLNNIWNRKVGILFIYAVAGSTYFIVLSFSN